MAYTFPIAYRDSSCVPPRTRMWRVGRGAQCMQGPYQGMVVAEKALRVYRSHAAASTGPEPCAQQDRVGGSGPVGCRT